MLYQFQKEQFLSPLREASYDDDGDEILLDFSDKVYNFDRLKEDVCYKLRGGSACSSCDAFFRTADGRAVLMEFKNCEPSSVSETQIKKKIFDSLYLLSLTFERGRTPEEIAKDLTFYVVYNVNKHVRRAPHSVNSSGSMDAFYGKMRHFAKLEPADRVKWNLWPFRGRLFRRVYTVDKADFIQNFYSHLFPANLD